MTLSLPDADARSLSDGQPAVAALQDAYAQDVGERRFPPRAMARGEGRWLRTMTGVADDTGLMGAKLIAAAPADGVVSYLIPLFDQRTAELVALLDGHSITGFRTAATSALAADLLAPAGALTVAVIGSGFEARNHVRALAAVRDLKAVHVYSPRAESRARFVAEQADLGCPVSAAESAEAAVAEADLVLCAARSRDETPTLRGAWLRPGATVVSIGSTLPEQREVDPEVLARADVLVADLVHEVLEDTGDLIAAHAAGVDVSATMASLADLVAGRTPGRTSAEQIAVYKSVGSAVQDLAVAAMCVRLAERAGTGTALASPVSPVHK